MLGISRNDTRNLRSFAFHQLAVERRKARNERGRNDSRARTIPRLRFLFFYISAFHPDFLFSFSFGFGFEFC